LPDALMGASVSAERATFVRTPSREREKMYVYIVLEMKVTKYRNLWSRQR
jgi:hypothetical protein